MEILNGMHGAKLFLTALAKAVGPTGASLGQMSYSNINIVNQQCKCSLLKSYCVTSHSRNQIIYTHNYWGLLIIQTLALLVIQTLGLALAFWYWLHRNHRNADGNLCLLLQMWTLSCLDLFVIYLRI